MSFTKTATQLLTKHGHKITKPRQIIIDIISQSSKPRNPYDIAKISNNTVNVATVYRTMELFEQLGLVHKIRSVDGYIACSTNHHADTSSNSRHPEPKTKPASRRQGSRTQQKTHCHHYAVCTNCHTVQELEILPTEGGHTHNHTLPQNFHSDKQVYELTGKCEKCVQ